MKTLQITLFFIANVIFITQSGRHIHQLRYGTESSVLDRFDAEKSKARSEKQMQVLVDDYAATSIEIRALEKGRKNSEATDIRQEHSDLYEKLDALKSEISDREHKAKELRDLWIFSAYGLSLILLGSIVYLRGTIWPGLAVLVTGFCILEYWSSPTYFGGGAYSEFHQLLVSKTILTLSALVALYLFWRKRDAIPPTGPSP